MKGFLYQLHIFLGVLVAIPVLAWALSGLLYAWPNTVEGGVIENIDAARVAVTPADALAKDAKIIEHYFGQSAAGLAPHLE